MIGGSTPPREQNQSSPLSRPTYRNNRICTFASLTVRNKPKTYPARMSMAKACLLWPESRHLQCTSACPLWVTVDICVATSDVRFTPQKRPRKQTSANDHV